MRGTRASLLLPGLTLGLLLYGALSCSGGSEETAAESASVEPFAPDAEATWEDCDTAILIAVDGLRPSDVVPPPEDDPRPRFPNLERLAAGARRFAGGVAPSTAGNASLATLLTGLRPPAHGVLSIHDPGRGRLDDSVETLAEGLAGSGWTTVASVAALRETRGVGGFAQGFTRFDGPRGTDLVRAADQVVLGLDDVLGGALEDGGDVFAFLTFGDTARGGDSNLDDPRAGDVVRRYLERFAPNDAALAETLRSMRADPGAALADLETRYARTRSTAQARAWRAARTSLALLAIDDAVGEVLARLERSGRAEHALVVVTGLRGRPDPAATVDGAPRIPRAIADVPVLVRAPGSVGATDGDGLVPLERIAPWVRATLEGRADSAALVADEALTFNGAGDVVAVRRSSGEQLESYAGGRTVVLEGGQVRSAGPDVRGADVAEGLPHVTVEADVEGGGAVATRWYTSSGRALDANDTRPRPAATGTFDAGGDVVLLDRTASLRLELDGEGLEPADVVLGGAQPARLDASPLPWVPVANGPALAEDDAAPLTFTRTESGAWSLRVEGEGPCEVLVGVWPPREPDDRLEVLRGPGVEQRRIAGRRDLVHLVGTCPLEAEFTKEAREDFAVVCVRNGALIGPDAMAADGSAFGAPGRFAFVVPAWQPRASDAIGDPLLAVARRPGAGAAPASRVRVTRIDPGPLPGVGSGFESVVQDLLERLSAGE